MAKTRVQPQKAAPRSRTDLWISLALLAVSFLLYAQVGHFDFVNYDDPDSVSDNAHVRGGLTVDNVKWAFTSGEAANWFPVTRLSHLLDVQMFGLRSGPLHLMNVLFHALSAVLLFVFLNGATKARWPSAVVAMLFAVHPLHVESVAWIAERKDVLSAMFWFLTLWLYVRHTKRPSAGRYIATIVSFAVGLMAKPMLVTLPVVLVLLDIWPLKRDAMKSLREKLPFFALALAGSIVTYLVQKTSGAVENVGAYPLGLRIANALVSYTTYIVKMVWPSGLAVFYPYPRELPLWEGALATVPLIVISAFAIRSFRHRPYFAIGWLWYLGTLVPVIGLIQVGAQARADRYTYIPSVGLEIMLVWGVAEMIRVRPRLQTPALVLGGATCVALAGATWAQTLHWENTHELFEHALAVTEGNYVAHHNLGIALAEVPGRLPEAITHYEAALRIRPESGRIHTDLATALAKTPGREQDAIREYQAAIQLLPDAAIPHNDLGNVLSQVGRVDEAIAEYQTALRLSPDYVDARRNLGSTLAKAGRMPEAIAQERDALKKMPDSAEAHNDLGAALAAGGQLPQAIEEYQAAIRLKPDDPELHYNLAGALAKTPGKAPQAIEELHTTLRLKPDYAQAENDLGTLLAQTSGNPAEAIGHFEAALKFKPDFADAHYNLGVALANTPGRMSDALAHFDAALKLKPDPELQALVNRLRSGK